MTRPAITPTSSIDTTNIDATNIDALTLAVADQAQLGATNGAGVGFYGTIPTNQGQALTAPLNSAAADLAAIADPDATDLPTALTLVNALKADRNGAVQTLANDLKLCLNNNGTALTEIRDNLGEVAGVGLLDITP